MRMPRTTPASAATFASCRHMNERSSCCGSASTVTRLLEGWRAEYQEWSKRSLKDKHYVYLWVDGVHFNIRLEADRQCILVLMGATAEGTKELIAITDGYRESEQSWKELLLDCKARGLEIEPSLAIGDGALGFWKAMRQVWETTKEQRCWVHKTANVLDKLPKGAQPKAKAALHGIYEAETKANGHGKDITFDETGKLLAVEEEVGIDSIPAAAKAAIEKQATGGKLRKVEKITAGEKVVYEAALTKNGKKSEVTFAADGSPAKED